MFYRNRSGRVVILNTYEIERNKRDQLFTPVSEDQLSPEERRAVGLSEVRSPEQVAEKEPQANEVRSPSKEDLKALRVEYQKKIGRRPFNGWDAEMLKKKIAEA